MKKKSLRQKHQLYNIPVLNIILAYAFPILGISIICAIFNFLEEPYKTGMSVVAAIIVLIIHCSWFREEYEGCFLPEGLKNRQVVTVACLTLAGMMITIIPQWISGGIVLPSATMTFAAASAGAGEETMFRAVIVAILMRMAKNKKHVISIIVFTSLVFGLTHVVNLEGGASPFGTFVQVISSSFAGMLLCVFYLRSGNILISMLYHGIYDYACFSQANLSTGIVGQLSAADVIFEVIGIAIEITAAVFLLRGHMDDILVLWHRIWKQTEQEK